MGSLFVNPSLLWGGLAIAAPILIFLFTRYRYQTLEWAALVFLQRALKRQQRRLRLENLLLLLIRCLILLLFALALARPHASQPSLSSDQDAVRNALLLLDTSYSMGYRLRSDTQETAFDRARRAASELLKNEETLAPGDRISIAAFDEQVRPLYVTPRYLSKKVRGEALLDLQDAPEIVLSERGTQLGEVFQVLHQLLRAFEAPDSGPLPAEDSPPSTKTIYLFTDLQRRGLLDDSGQLLDPSLRSRAKSIGALGGQLVLVDCGAEDPENATILRLKTREPVVGLGLPCHVQVVVKNWSSVDLENLTVEYFVDAEIEGEERSPQQTVSLSIPAGEERAPRPLSYVFHSDGMHRVAVRVKSDDLIIDNLRHLALEVRDQVRVLLIDGERSRDPWESETYFLSEVLSLSEVPDSPSLLETEIIGEEQVTEKDLDAFDVVLAANVVSFNDEAITALERYARGGGVVIFCMGGLVDATAYNDLLWREGLGLFPCQLLDPCGGTRAVAQTDEAAPEWVMSAQDVDTELLSMFRSEEMLPWLRMPSIFGFYRVQLAGEHTPAMPLVSLKVVPKPSDDGLGGPPAADQSGSPLLIERRFGQGQVVAWLSSLDYAWNNCVVYDGFYLPFWRQLIMLLAQRSRPQLNLPLGARFERTFHAEEFSAQVTIEAPRSSGRVETVAMQRQEGSDLYRLQYPDENRPGLEYSGLYTIKRSAGPRRSGATTADYFTANIDPYEGDLARYSASELEAALKIPVKSLRAQNLNAHFKRGLGTSPTREYWRELLLGVLLLLVLESTLAALFGRRRRR